jgi:two-component system NtrC family sensor kinase
LVAASLEMIRGRLRRCGIEVKLDHDPASRLRCVRTQLSQVLPNLIVNAPQATEAAPRTRPGRLRARTRRLADDMLIEVSDNGRGIPAKDLPRIFDPFFTTKGAGEGTGLGLSVCHNTVAAHGGRVEVGSEPGVGSCFRVYLPRSTSREAP